MELNDFSKRIKVSESEYRAYLAAERGVSEEVIAAQGLGPTMTNFMKIVLKHADVEELASVDRDAVYAAWPDKKDAEELFTELYVRDLVDETEAGAIVVTQLGLDAGPYLGT